MSDMPQCRQYQPLDLVILNTLADHILKIHTAKGFHDSELEAQGVGRYTSNLHEEVSEIWTAYRKGLLNEPCDKANEMKALGLEPLTYFEEELADVIIRALDMAGFYGVDIGKAVAVKDAFNQTRSFRHGGKQA